MGGGKARVKDKKSGGPEGSKIKLLGVRARNDEARNRRPAVAKVYLKDPLVVGDRPDLYGEVMVDGDLFIAPGPTSARFEVIDRDPGGKVHRTIKPKLEAGVLRFSASIGSRQEAQLNAWASAVDALETFQQPIALGREVPWAFPESRLQIVPQAKQEANALYSRQARAVHLGFFEAKDDAEEEAPARGRRAAPKPVVRTALSHDIVAHETGHAILDGLRPLYLESSDPETHAFHEFVADLSAMLSLLQHRDVVRQVARKREDTGGTLREVIAALAPEFGAAYFGAAARSPLRSAANDVTYADVQNVHTPHERSQVLTGLAFDVLERFVGIELERRKKELRVEPNGSDVFRACWKAHRQLCGLFLRSLDLLPPARIGFKELAAILLHVDRQAHPHDTAGYHDALRKAIQTRGILPTNGTNRPRHLKCEALSERDIDLIHSSRVGAYKFVHANRRVLEIPKDVDVRVLDVATNSREGPRGYRPNRETIIQYVWDVRVPVPGAAARTLGELTLHPGGTLVVDDQVNVLYWIHQDLDQKAQQASAKRVARLIDAGMVDEAQAQSDRPLAIVRDDRGRARVQLRTTAHSTWEGAEQ